MVIMFFGICRGIKNAQKMKIKSAHGGLKQLKQFQVTRTHDRNKLSVKYKTIELRLSPPNSS